MLRRMEQARQSTKDSEQQLKQFKSACETGYQFALGTIRERYMNDADPANRLYYHIVQHTETVTENTSSILKKMGASEREVALGELSGGFHDIVQVWDNPIDEYLGIRKRVRTPGVSERASILEAKKYMIGVNKQKGNIFTTEDIDIVEEAILATIPDFKMTRLGLLVSQPFLHNNSSNIALAVALSDLGTAALVGGKRFFSDSIALFYEDYPDFSTLVKLANHNNPLLKETLIRYMRNHLNLQNGFIATRENNLETELGDFYKNQAVRDLFCNFESSKQQITNLGNIDNLSYEELLKIFSYELPTPIS